MLWPEMQQHGVSMTAMGPLATNMWLIRVSVAYGLVSRRLHQTCSDMQTYDSAAPLVDGRVMLALAHDVGSAH